MRDDGRSAIVVVVSSLNVGGPQRSLLSLLNEIDSTKFKVDLVILNPARDELRDFIPGHVNVVATPRLVTAATLPKDEFIASLARLLRAFPMHVSLRVLGCLLRGLVTRRSASSVRQRVWRVCAPYLPRLGNAYDVGIGVLGLSTYALVDLVQADRKYHWIRSDSRMLDRDRSIEASYFSVVNGAIAVSSAVKDAFLEVYPEFDRPIRVFKNDTSSLRVLEASPLRHWGKTGSSQLRLLTVTRLDPLKGLEIAAEACSILLGRGYSVSWLVLGEGPHRAEIEKQILQLGVENSFRLLGSELDVGKYLQVADVFVHPSRAEGRSNSVEEARAFGKAIVATCYPTVVDQVEHGVNGLVAEMSGVAVADAVEELILDVQYRIRLGRAAASAYAAEREDPNTLFTAISASSVSE